MAAGEERERERERKREGERERERERLRLTRQECFYISNSFHSHYLAVLSILQATVHCEHETVTSTGDKQNYIIFTCFQLIRSVSSTLTLEMSILWIYSVV